MAISRTSQVYIQIAACTKELTEGAVFSCDPSIGSSSSMPGWAVYIQGKYVASGTIDLPRTKPIPDRLKTLARELTKLYSKYPCDVLVYEEIPAQRHGMGNANAHASLLKALGVILSVSGPEHTVGIMPVSWKPLISEQYQKGDEADAIEIGRIVIDQAYIQQEEAKNGKSVTKKATKN